MIIYNAPAKKKLKNIIYFTNESSCDILLKADDLKMIWPN